MRRAEHSTPRNRERQPAGLPEDHPLLLPAWRAARLAGDMLLAGTRQDLQVSTKSTRTDVVTQMDRAAERLVVESILELRAEDAILGEEGSDRAGTSGVRWIVDPLDGTVNYLYGLPGWAVSIAAEVNGGVEVAVVDVPGYGETFVAVRGAGSFVASDLGVDRLRARTTTDLSQCLVATGFGYASERRAAQAQALTAILPRVRDIRRAGAAAVDLCWAGAGRVDCYYERGTQPWDHAAGLLVATEAGLVAGGPPGAAPSPDLVWVAPAGVAAEFAALLATAGAHQG